MDAVNIQTKFGLGEIVTTHQGADDRERIWFSPHCLRPELETQMSLGF